MEEAPRINRLPQFALLFMAVLSFGNLLGVSISNVVIPAGIAFYFMQKVFIKEPHPTHDALDIKNMFFLIKQQNKWLWLFLPVLVTIINVTISMNFLPQYIEYETARAGAFVAIEFSARTILLFFIFALGEEIAWRTFFQYELSKYVKPAFAIILSSFLFTIGHFQSGPFTLVLYGLFFTFINSCLYGIVFYQTKNAWMSTFAHFIANMFEITMYLTIVM